MQVATRMGPGMPGTLLAWTLSPSPSQPQRFRVEAGLGYASVVDSPADCPTTPWCTHGS